MNSTDRHGRRREAPSSTRCRPECRVCAQPIEQRCFCLYHCDEGNPVRLCCPECANHYVDSRRATDKHGAISRHGEGPAGLLNGQALRLESGAGNSIVKALVVHDSQFMLEILARTLQKAAGSVMVGTATDAYQALRCVSAFSPELVLMAIHMPGLTGIHAARYIKEAEHSPAVILINPENCPVAKALAERAGADEFLSTEGKFRRRLIRMVNHLLGSPAGRRASGSGNPFGHSLDCESNQEGNQ